MKNNKRKPIILLDEYERKTDEDCDGKIYFPEEPEKDYQEKEIKKIWKNQHLKI